MTSISFSAPRVEQEQVSNEILELSFEEKEYRRHCLYGQEQMTNESIDMLQTLLNTLKDELDSLRTPEKQVYLRAQDQCPDYVNSRDFQLMFLRADRYDAKKAARRITMYWDEKLKIFGEDHTFKPLTLADMREEDYFALTNGGVQALPEQDNVGRGILFTNPGKWDHGVQSRGSVLRTCFYNAHVLVAYNTLIQKKGVIILSASRSILKAQDFDRCLTKRLLKLANTALPIRIVAFHHVIRSNIVAMLMPYVFYLMGKDLRMRYTPHNGNSDNVILDDLAEYGLDSTILPSEVGGARNWNPDLFLEFHRKQESDSNINLLLHAC